MKRKVAEIIRVLDLEFIAVNKEDVAKRPEGEHGEESNHQPKPDRPISAETRGSDRLGRRGFRG
jgi:hypothetical protein